jgi:signal-transduction protein with cAMP-binding, CBS, and nucleotidyltransferase domain
MSPISFRSTDPATPVRHLANRNLATVDPDATLQDVAEELALDELGLVLVQYGAEPVGVVSERDLVTVIASGGDLESQAASLMTVDLVSVSEDTPVLDVARLMIDAGVRHILVRGEGPARDPGGGPVTGIVSMRDVVAFVLGDTGS